MFISHHVKIVLHGEQSYQCRYHLLDRESS